MNGVRSLWGVHVNAAGLAGLEATENARVTMRLCTVQRCRQDGATARNAATLLLASRCQFVENRHSGLATFGSAIAQAWACTFRANRQMGVLAADEGYGHLLGNTFHRQWGGAALAPIQGLLAREGNRYRFL